MELISNKFGSIWSAMNRVPGRRRASIAGFGYGEILIIISVLSIVALSMLNVTVRMSVEANRNSNYSQLFVFKQNINSLILDASSWKNTIMANAANGKFPLGKMDCLARSLPCTVDGSATGLPIQNQPFAIVDGAGNVLYDGTSSASGLTAAGTACSLAGGNTTGTNSPGAAKAATCIFRYILHWSANCSPGNCVDPLVDVSAQLVVSDSLNQGLVINPSLYSLTVIARAAQ